MVSPTPPPLGEDAVDDILFFARTADLPELQSALTAAASASDLSQRAVLERAVDPHSGNTALHMAAANGHTDILKFLLPLLKETAGEEKQSSVDLRNAAGNTPLHWAALNGHAAAAQLLLEAGADADAKNQVGHDAAYEAERNGKDELVTLLIGWGQEELEEGIKEGEAVAENGEGKAEGSKDGGVQEVGDKVGELKVTGEGG